MDRIKALSHLYLAGRDAPLYHRTGWDSLAAIFQSNQLTGKDASGSFEKAEYQRPGVSLTRDLNFALTWMSSRQTVNVVLVLDQTKLAQRQKLIPRDYWGQGIRRPDTKYQRNEVTQHESEEFVPGDINNLMDVLLYVITPQSTLDNLRKKAGDAAWDPAIQKFCDAALSMGLQSKAMQDAVVDLREQIGKPHRQPVAGRDAPLYHATDCEAALAIIESDTLNAGDDYHEGEEEAVQTPGVSLTRDIRFAQNHNDIVLKLNQTKLVQNHALRPRDYFGVHPDKFLQGEGARTESEEFIAGPLTNVHLYLDSIAVSPKYVKGVLKNPVYRAHLKQLMTHPKFDAEQKIVLEKVLPQYEAPAKTPGLMAPRKVQTSINALASMFLAGRDAMLYHSTYPEYAGAILASNTIKGSTASARHEKGGVFDQPGVSLTRDLSLATHWSDPGVVFALDQRALAQNYKLLPRNYWGGAKGDKFTRGESEEFVPGNITNLNKYIRAIFMTDKTIALVKHSGQVTEFQLKALLGGYDAILQLTRHPKFEARQRIMLIDAMKASGFFPADFSLDRQAKSGHLYHATSLPALMRILKSNKLEGGEIYGDWEDEAYHRKGVSLTRDQRFAESWRRPRGGVVLVLDQAKLAQRHKLIPRDYYVGSVDETQVRSEAEEFLPGDVTNLDQYITRIYLSPDRMATMVKGDTHPSVQQLRSLVVLAHHPKFDPTQRQALLKLLNETMTEGQTYVP
jgi:hypothetical protein